MNRVSAWNLGVFAAALLVSTAVGWVPRLRTESVRTAAGPAPASTPETLVDHGGATVTRGSSNRIVSLSTISDAVLLEVCEPDRIVSFTGFSARSASRSFRFAGKPTIESATEIEKILALHPDLVFVSSADPRQPARLREAGLKVFEMGPMRGLVTLIPNIREVAALVGHPERGERLITALVAEMSSVASDVPVSARKRGIYLSIYGGRLFGGAAGTSYHDVLTAAGVVDAASAFHDWPDYSVEQILAIDPDVIVTNPGMRDRICEHAGFGSLRACASPTGIATVDDDLLGDPGPAMLDAARAVRTAVYGPTPSGGILGQDTQSGGR